MFNTLINNHVNSVVVIVCLIGVPACKMPLLMSRKDILNCIFVMHLVPLDLVLRVDREKCWL